MLTQDQKNFFQTFGFLHFPGLFADDIGDITRAFEEVWQRRGHRHDGRQRSAVAPFIDQHEDLVTLLDDPRVQSIAAGLAGEDFNYVSSDGNYYVGDTRWHCDSWHEDKAYVKIAWYLDPVARDSGALRVIPGSHKLDAYRADLGDKVVNAKKAWGIHGRDVPGTALETKPGDVVCFHHNCLHASYGGSTRRRMFTIDVCSHYEPDRVGELRDFMAIFARKGQDSIWGPRVYDDAAPAERKRHVQQVRENESFMSEVAKKAREGQAPAPASSY